MTFPPADRCCRWLLAPFGGRVSGFRALLSVSPGTADCRSLEGWQGRGPRQATEAADWGWRPRCGRDATPTHRVPEELGVASAAPPPHPPTPYPRGLQSVLAWPRMTVHRSLPLPRPQFPPQPQ